LILVCKCFNLISSYHGYSVLKFIIFAVTANNNAIIKNMIEIA
jgi:hypothetical protein